MNKTFRSVCILLIAALLFCTGCASQVKSIKSATINDDGELVLRYTDGTKANLGVVVGTDGENGKDGQDGQDGQDGSDGRDGADGTDGDSGIGGSSAVLATAKALRSAVSIFCDFSSYSSAGSGVIYRLDKSTGNAFIITNYHVVYDSSYRYNNGICRDIYVYLYGSELADHELKATYVGGSQNYDIAVLYVEGSELLKGDFASAVTVADSDLVCAGDIAIAVGNPESMGISASQGVVSVDSEHITMTAADERTEVSFRVMRIDTAVNPGNSGGGLFNDKGELIGIVNAKTSDTSVENIGYAIPSNIALAVAENIREHCFGTTQTAVQRALMGVTVATTESHAVLDESTGKVRVVETVEVYEVNRGSLAYGKLEAGDILVSAVIGGKTVQITRQHHIVDAMLNARLGDTVVVSVLRNGEAMEFAMVVTSDCITEY